MDKMNEAEVFGETYIRIVLKFSQNLKYIEQNNVVQP